MFTKGKNQHHIQTNLQKSNEEIYSYLYIFFLTNSLKVP